MGNKLRWVLKPKPYPYPDELEALESKWGSISIQVFDENCNQQILMMTQWDLATLISWFDENERFLRCSSSTSCEIDLCAQPFESLAQALNRNQDRDFLEGEEEIEDLWFDSLFEFREHHSLRFTMRGAKIPEIIIDLNHGAGEISRSDETCNWSYSFDMQEFLEDLQQTKARYPSASYVGIADGAESN